MLAATLAGSEPFNVLTETSGLQHTAMTHPTCEQGLPGSQRQQGTRTPVLALTSIEAGTDDEAC